MTDCKFANYTGSATTTPESDTSIKTVVMTPVIPDVNLDKVIAALDKNAHKESLGKCAHYVGLALKAGGGTLNGNPKPTDKERPVAAKNWGCLLKRNGFKELTTKVDDNYTPVKGDAVIIQSHDEDGYGHIAIYNGTQWVSDFRQKIYMLKGMKNPQHFPESKTPIQDSFYPGPGYRSEKPSYIIYRKSDWK